MAKTRSRLAAGADALSHHRHEECLRALQEADDAASLLASDERFFNHTAVAVFLTEHQAAATALRSKVKDTLRERTMADVKRRLSAAMSQAEELYAHFRFEEALAQLHVVRTMMEEEAGAEAENNAEIAARATALTERHQKEHLAREAVRRALSAR